MFKKCIGWCILAGIYSASLNVHATEEGTGWRKIVDIGCHNVDVIFFVILDGPSFGASPTVRAARRTNFDSITMIRQLEGEGLLSC